MQVDAKTEEYEHVELFGRPVLFTNFRIDRATVPEGWHCYDIRGSGSDPGELAYLERHVLVNHAGTILSPWEIRFPKGKDCRKIKNKISFYGEAVTLAEFCEMNGLDSGIQRPASHDEAGPFHTMTMGG